MEGGDVYGQELILDLHECDSATFTRRSIRRYCKQLCKRIGMVRGPLRWWDDYWTPWWWKETEPHLKGTTAVQFITTSDIRIHALDLQRAIRLNVFSCKEFDPSIVKKFTAQWFRGIVVNELFIDRL